MVGSAIRHDRNLWAASLGVEWRCTRQTVKTGSALVPCEPPLSMVRVRSDLVIGGSGQFRPETPLSSLPQLRSDPVCGALSCEMGGQSS